MPFRVLWVGLLVGFAIAGCQPTPPPTVSEAPPTASPTDPTVDATENDQGEGSDVAATPTSSDRFEPMPGNPDCAVPEDIATDRFVADARSIAINATREAAIAAMGQEPTTEEAGQPTNLIWEIPAKSGGFYQIKLGFIGDALMGSRLIAPVGDRTCQWKILPPQN